MAPQSLTALRQALSSKLSLDELRTLCFDLGLDYENLAGDAKDAKIVTLLTALSQRNRLDDLRTIGPSVRPDIAWDDLCVSITPDSPGHVPIRFLPADLPASYVARPAALQALRTALLQPQAHVGVVAATALHGAGGLGKTVLARAICEDPTIQERYKDGVLWATLGQSADPARHQRNWIDALGGDVAAASDPDRGKVELQELLAERKMLLILDDVWNDQDASPLQVSAPGCGILLTTRDTAQAHGATLLRLDVMTVHESQQLLQQASSEQLNHTLAEQIAARLGRLPLALQIAGALLASGLTWNDILEALNAGDLTFLDHGQRSVLAVIQASVSSLEVDQATRYHELVIFPRAEPLNLAAITRLWTQTADLKSYQTKRLLALFRERALLPANDILHDLHVDYLRTVVALTDTARLHSTFVDSYGAPSAWAPLPDDDSGYGWRALASHLSQAGRHNDLYTLLTNISYLQGKIARLGTSALGDDFRLLPDDTAIQAIAGAIRLGAHILDRVPHELTNQLYGRLGNLVLLHTSPPMDQPCFQIRSQSLTTPGGPLLRTLAGHTAGVRACTFSSDGTLALSASWDRTLRLWDVASGQLLHLLEGHMNWVTACTFSPDGSYALSASWDRTLRLWDVASGQSLHLLEGHTNWVTACTFSPDGTLALSASEDRILRLWDMASNQPLHRLLGHTAQVTACTFSPDGTLALSASEDRTLRLWDLKTSQPIHIFQGHTSTVTACTFSPDGSYALSASEDTTLRLWDPKTGQPIHRLKGHPSAVTACAFSPDGSHALSASEDRTLRLWDLKTGQPLHLLEGHTAQVTACTFSPDGALALSASLDSILRLWDVRSGQPIHHLLGHTAQVTACTFSPDGSYALSASRDRILRLWDVKTGQSLHLLVGHTDTVGACTFSPDGSYVLSASYDRTLRLWDVTRGMETAGWHADASLTCCAFHPDSRQIIAGDQRGAVHFLDLHLPEHNER